MPPKKTPATPTQKKAAVATKSPVEKRAARYRTRRPVSLSDRLYRALQQRLYLVHASPIDNHGRSCELLVLGSTGNVYQVQLCERPTCNCPDFYKHHDLCKHLMFVMHKVLGLSQNDPLSYQKAYLASELDQIFEIMQRRNIGEVLANEKVRAAVTCKDNTSNPESDDSVQRKAIEADSDCPICFDSLKDCPLAELTFCRAACGTNFHVDCIRRWSAQQCGQPSCPNCRQTWISDEHSINGGSTNEGYLNLGKLQGQPSVRDTSTYYEPYFERSRKYRHW
jgi:hypothetical protein